MADTPTNDPTQQFLVGGAPAAEQLIEFQGQKFESMQQLEATVANYIRQTQAEIEQLKGAASVRPAAPPPQPTPQQPQQFDNDAHFKVLASDPRNAYKQWLRYEMFGDPNAPVDPVQVIRETAITSMQLRSQLQQLQLKNDHPEINWADPKQTEQIAQLAQQHGSEGAIAILQREGKLPTRQHYEAWKADQMRAMLGQPPQGMPQQPAPAASLWVSATGTTVNPGNVVPIQPPPAVPRSGAAPQQQYDMNAIKARLDELVAIPVSQQTPQSNAEFEKLWGIMNAHQQKVG